MSETTVRPGAYPEDLLAALQAAGGEPHEPAAWEDLEAIAAKYQQPDPVAELYRAVLERELSRDLAERIAVRAVRFHDEWFGEEEPLLAVLERLLAIDPTAAWAFERASLLHTIAERWDALLALYDRALSVTADPVRRALLLSEAANAAKDFAGQTDRAIGYLDELVRLAPADAQRAAGLERLLEQRGRHADLVALWRARLPVLPPAQAQAVRARIATTSLELLAAPAAALATVKEMISGVGEDEAINRLLERIAATEGDVAGRREALALAKARYASASRGDDVVRVLRAELALATGPERVATHLELERRLTEAGRPAEARAHTAEVLLALPEDDAALERLDALSRATDGLASLAEVIARAAESAAPPRAIALRLRAARVLAEDVGDDAAAIALYRRVLADDARSPADGRSAGEALAALLERGGHTAELVSVVERLATEATDPVEQRGLWARVAGLAEGLGYPARALEAWERRLAKDPADRDAEDAVIELFDRLDRGDALVAALERRAARTKSKPEKRADLVRITSVLADRLGDASRAIDEWRAIERGFGRDEETTDALTRLLNASERWDELAALLSEIAPTETDPKRQARAHRRLGDVLRDRLAAPVRAVEEYRAALAIDPTDGPARRGLEALLDDPSCRALAVAALVAAYHTAGDWSATLALVDVRLALADDDATRALLLLEAAEAAEQRGDDAPAALGYLARAFALAPEDTDIESELARLAAATDDWSRAASAYQHAADASTGDRARALRTRFAELLEERVGDHEGALAAYDAARRAALGDLAAASSVVRVAGRLGRWSTAATAVVEHAAVSALAEPALLALAEEAAATSGGWDGLAESLEATVAASANLDRRAAHALELRLAAWHRDRRHDRATAELALVRATRHAPDDVATLAALAELQRSAPGPALIGTLLRLADLGADALAALREAADVTVSGGGDAAAILTDLHARAREAWKTGSDARAPEIAGWTLDRLVALHEGRGEHARAVALLTEDATLPLALADSHALLHRAAALAAGPLADAPGAIALYRTILEGDAANADAIANLAELYESTGMVAPLSAILAHELTLAPPLERRLALRLRIAEAARTLGDHARAIAILAESLAEAPGDRAAIAATSELLLADGRFADLVATLDAQAAELEATDPERATELLAEAAEVVERRVGDAARAAKLLGRAAALRESPAVLDALARLATASGDHPAAVRWLDRRLAAATPSERATLLLRQADALVASGREGRARATLEAAAAESPDARELVAALASLYRRTGAWEPLVALLARAGEHEPDVGARVSFLAEIADVQRHRLAAPDLAVASLETAQRLAPDDKVVRAALADALRVAGRLDEARAMLESLIEEFGRRRPAERASLHLQLAEVARARGDVKEALAQLDVAASMDMSDARVLSLLGQLAAESGQLERAERAYRALLLVARRSRDAAAVGQAETLFALSQIATRLADEARANELLETAFEAAGVSEREASRFEAALRQAGRDDLLLRALEARVGRTAGHPGEARALAELGQLLARSSDRRGEAVELLLRAIDAAPGDAVARASARAVAAQAGASPRLAGILDQQWRRTRDDDPTLGAEIAIDLARLHEEDTLDRAAALAIYRALHERGESLREALAGEVRVARALGDRAAETSALERTIDASADDVGEGAQVEALYELAALELSGDPDARARGVATLARAMDREPQPTRAASVLRDAVAAAEDHAVAVAYERVARVTGDRATLLDAIERLTSLAEDGANEAFGPTSRAGSNLFREGVELALALGEDDRAEALLRRAALAGSEGEPGLVVWALVGLAERRKTAGDAAGAARWLAQAVDVAEPGDAWALGIDLATMAAGPLGDLALAATTYERLLERDPAERAVWEPLLDVYRRMGALDRLDALIAKTVDAVFDPDDRRRLRMERARLSLTAGRDDDAARVLADVLEEDRDDLAAGELLAEIYERGGRSDDLAELLARLVEAARSRAEVEPIVTLTVRLAAALAPKGVSSPRRLDAVDAYRASLDVAPGEHRLLTPLLALFTADDDLRERTDVMTRLLEVETESRAGDLALALAALHDEAGSDDEALAALALGFSRAPKESRVRDRLAARYEQRGDLAGLAAMWVTEAAQLPPAEAIARLRDAAAAYRDRLGDPRAAVDALRKARALAPRDFALVTETVRSLDAAGDVDAALAEASAALEAAAPDARVALLRLRAEVLLARDRDAVDDLEAALAAGDATATGDLVRALEGRISRGVDRVAERAATMRLAALLVAADDGERAQSLVAAWTDKSPDDVAALRELLAIETAIEAWEAASETARRLISVDDGTGQVAAARALLHAATRLGRPEDAREGLERASRMNPDDASLRAELRALYVALGATRELAQIALAEAALEDDPAKKLVLLREAGAAFVSAREPARALPPLREALELRHGDHEATIQLSDALIALQELPDATALLDAAIAGHKGRRSKEVAALQHRMARVAFAAGDRNVEMAWLNVALDADLQSGEVASELAVVATELGQVEIAMKALRAVTMMKVPGPMTKAEAYLRQGMIAHHQGDGRRASLLARKALSEDASLESARQFLRDLGEKA